MQRNTTKRIKLLTLLAAAAAFFAFLSLLALRHFEKSSLAASMFKTGGQHALIGFIENGADISARNADGETILIKLCRQNLADSNRLSIDYILDKTAIDVNAKDLRGTTALMRCASLADIRTAKQLIKRGARVEDCDHSGQNAMFYLCCTSFPDDNAVEFAKTLISCRINVNALDSSGKSCFSYLGPSSKLKEFLGKAAPQSENRN